MFEESLSKIVRRNQKNDFQQNYNRLNFFIDKLNQKIVGRIQLVQQIYIQDYKAQVKQMSEQLKVIRGVLDQELLRQRSNERMFYLQEERDFFRGQVMKLNEELNALNRNNQKLKKSLDDAVCQAKNYKSLVYGFQKKMFRVQNDAIQMEKLKNQKVVDVAPIDKLKQSSSLSPYKTAVTRFSQGSNNLLLRTDRTNFKSEQKIKHINTKILPIDSEVRRRQQILQQCIKDIKKKIYYRSLDDRQTAKIHFDQEKRVPFQKFTRKDKQELIQSILSHEDILQEFYKFMIGKKDTLEKSPKQNFASKSAFSQKMFKIKLCGLTR